MTLENNEVLYKLMQSLDNDDNAGFVELTSQKIKQIKNDRLQELQLPREKLKEYHQKLRHYRYVENIDDIQYGQYIRWIPLNIESMDDLKLKNGGIISDIKIVNDDDVHIVCKNNMNRFFQIKLEENLIFQKLTPNEQILLSALDYISK